MGDEAKPVKPAFAVDGMHLLRTTQQIQYQLSQMADQKASMLLGVTFLIFTISVAQVRAAGPQPAIIILASAAFLAAVLAVLAVLPSSKTPPRADGVANILFFGSFSQLPEDEYVERLLGIVTDTRSIYEAFAHDIYQNGRILAGKKYRFIGYAYRVLLTGLICSLVAFLAPVAMTLFRA